MQFTIFDYGQHVAAKVGLKAEIGELAARAVFDTVRLELLLKQEAHIPGIGVIRMELLGSQIRRHRDHGGPIYTRTKPRFKLKVRKDFSLLATSIREVQTYADPVGFINPNGECNGVKVAPDGWQFKISSPKQHYIFMWHRMGLQTHMTFGPTCSSCSPEESEQTFREWLKNRREKLAAKKVAACSLTRAERATRAIARKAEVRRAKQEL